MDFERTVFVGNLPFDVREEELRQLCQTVGKVENVRVIRSPVTHMGIGIGYVRFSTKEGKWFLKIRNEGCHSTA